MFETVRCGPQSFIQAVIAMFAPDGSTDLRDIARRSFCGRGQGGRQRWRPSPVRGAPPFRVSDLPISSPEPPGGHYRASILDV